MKHKKQDFEIIGDQCVSWEKKNKNVEIPIVFKQLKKVKA
jgi:hypothetical protein